MIAVVEEGRLSLTFLRASNLVLAYKEFRGMIGNYSDTGESFLFNGFMSTKLWLLAPNKTM